MVLVRTNLGIDKCFKEYIIVSWPFFTVQPDTVNEFEANIILMLKNIIDFPV